jgi:hypothetical protein
MYVGNYFYTLERQYEKKKATYYSIGEKHGTLRSIDYIDGWGNESSLLHVTTSDDPEQLEIKQGQ